MRLFILVKRNKDMENDILFYFCIYKYIYICIFRIIPFLFVDSSSSFFFFYCPLINKT